ncbi:MAG: hypothetical protein QW407_06860 [Thermofilaceae archaeon]
MSDRRGRQPVIPSQSFPVTYGSQTLPRRTGSSCEELNRKRAGGFSPEFTVWWSFKDRVLAKLLCNALVEEELAAWEGDRIKLKRSPEKPAFTTIKAATWCLLSTAL